MDDGFEQELSFKSSGDGLLMVSHWDLDRGGAFDGVPATEALFRLFDWQFAA